MRNGERREGKEKGKEKRGEKKRKKENGEKILGRKERGIPGKRKEERTKTINSMMHVSVFGSCWQGYTEAAGCSGRWW